MPDPQTDLHTLSNGQQVSTAGMDPQSAQILLNTIEHRLREQQRGFGPSSGKGSPPRALDILHQSPLGTAAHVVTDPRNRSGVGGLTGGLIGLGLGGPPGAALGAFLGGTGGSLLQPHAVNATPQEIIPGALGDGAMQALFEVLGMPAAKYAPAIAENAGKRLMMHSFGNQENVMREMPGGPSRANLEKLAEGAYQDLGYRTPIGPSGNAAEKISDLIRGDVAQKQAILQGPLGDTPVSPLAGVHPVTTHTGEVIDPLSALYDRLQGQTKNRAAVGQTVRDTVVGNPTGRGRGTGFIADRRLGAYVPKTFEVPNPDLAKLVQQYADDPQLQQIAIDSSGLPATVSQELQMPQMRPQVSARDMNDLVNQHYRMLDDKGAYQFDKAGNASRDALKALTQGQKEAYVAAVPEIAPLNAAISRRIPLREALNAAEVKGLERPPFRFGESAAVALGNPRFALTSLLNRPGIERTLGRGLMDVGRGSATPEVLRQGIGNIDRLVWRLLHPDTPPPREVK